MSTGLSRATAYRTVAGFAKTELLSGVTTIRTVGGLGTFDTRLRDGIASGKKIGPRILAANEGISVPGGPPVCGHPRFRSGAQRGNGDEDHRPHDLLVRRDPQRRAAGAEGLCRRVPVQHGAGDYRHGAVRCGGQISAGGYPGHSGKPGSDAGGADGAARRIVSDKTLV